MSSIMSTPRSDACCGPTSAAAAIVGVFMFSVWTNRGERGRQTCRVIERERERLATIGYAIVFFCRGRGKDKI